MTIIIPLAVLSIVIAWMLRPYTGMPVQRKFAMLAVIIPSALIALSAVIAQILYNAAGNYRVAEVSNALFITGLGIVGAAILATPGFAIARRGEIARGTGFGLCIAVLISIIDLALLEWLAGV